MARSMTHDSKILVDKWMNEIRSQLIKKKNKEN